MGRGSQWILAAGRKRLPMDIGLVLLVGLAAGWVAAKLWPTGLAATHRLMSASDTQGATQAKPGLSKGERLHRLTTLLDAVYQASAHPNEVKGVPEFGEAVDLLAGAGTPLNEVLDYAKGTSAAMSAAAFAALARRADGAEVAARIPAALDTMPAWQVQYALEYLAGLAQPLPPGAPLIAVQAWWADNNPLRHTFVAYLTAMTARGVVATLGDDVAGLPVEQQERIKDFVGTLRHPMAEALAGLLASRPAMDPSAVASDPLFLSSIGRFWDGEINLPIEPHAWTDALDDAAKALERVPIRSLLISGEPLVGKTSFLHLLARRLKGKGWRVFEAGGADLQAGQQYIGQLEGRIRQAIEELAVANKTIWYVPDLLALALSGTNLSQSASILDQILPAIASGRLVVWGEASGKSTARLLEMRPAVRRSFEVVRLEALDANATQALADQVADRMAESLGLSCEPEFTEAALDAASHYLSASAMPGCVITLMRIASLRAQQGKSGGGTLTRRDILDALAQMTGLPPSIIDGSERLDIAQTTAFFSQRVIGQPEAVAAVVERIAMLKSGLNDPAKPFGVFLFAGPTGTGKTELTKAVAEFLFGSTERMIRLDMSEYQAPDSIIKILGGPGLPAESDTLITRIRKQPFSLILMDELEKSHPNVWDLLLQVFDEGRLTDTNGQTADFRHCLIILTTNLGATGHQSSGLGFAPMASAYTTDQVLRAIGQTFRPEFQNRLDKVIVFRPLTREHMRGILKKELDRLFERRGLKDRAWAVEWEATALEFLLEKGFSTDMGARPLKRAIDQFVVAPLAAAIVERRAPEGEQFVFVRSNGIEMQAEFVDPDGDGSGVPVLAPAVTGARETGAPLVERGEPAAMPTLGSIILAPEVSAAEVTLLAEREMALGDRLEAEAWGQQKAALSEAINDPAFWTRADRFEVLSRFELMDRLSVGAATAHSLLERLTKGRVQSGRPARELIARLAQQIWLVSEGLKDLDEEAPVEVALMVEAALEGTTGARGASADWRREIVDMYRGWCRRRAMQLVELDASADGAPAILLISGFGAHRLLSREAGLHVLEQPETDTTPPRIAARVLVIAAPHSSNSRAQRRSVLAQEFGKAPRPSAVVRRYRRVPSPMVRSADASWRTGKLDAVLAGDFDIISGAAE